MDIENWSAIFVQLDRTDRSMAQPNSMHRIEEGSRILHLPTDSVQRLLNDEQSRVRPGCVESWIVLELGIDAGDEFFVIQCIKPGGVPTGAVCTERLLTHH